MEPAAFWFTVRVEREAVQMLNVGGIGMLMPLEFMRPPRAPSP
jgi:hypothetical protein